MDNPYKILITLLVVAAACIAYYAFGKDKN